MEEEEILPRTKNWCPLNLSLLFSFSKPCADKALRPRVARSGVRRGSALLTALVAHGLGAWLVLSLVACSGSEGVSRFRLQYDDWYRANPPATEPPSGSDLALLERHRPIYWLGEGADEPIRFYEDYIAHGTLFDAYGEVLAENPSAELLNTHARDPQVLFLHRPERATNGAQPVVYGRVRRDSGLLFGEEQRLVFLTYTLVFPRSGLLAGLSWWQEWAAHTFADAKDWHQLDHYINVTLALDEEALEQGETRAIAAEFQHHNYTRTWRLGGTAGTPEQGYLPWPEDGRLEIDIALRSNEAYPHLGASPRRWPAASFLSEKVVAWFIQGGEPPPRSMTGWDHTAPSRRLDLPLLALAPADAFYTFRGSLGAKRLLPGRSGPPGADYNTLATLKDPLTSMLVSYWRPGLRGWQEIVPQTLQAAWEGQEIALDPFRALFEADWQGTSLAEGG